MSSLKQFRSSVITGLFVVLCLPAGSFFLSGYQRYVASQDKKTAMIRKVELLNHRRIDRQQKQQNLLKLNHFVKNAQLLGLIRKKWSVYHVDIQDSVTFTEMKKLLVQCTNGDSHYFKPTSFHIKSIEANDDSKKTPGNITRNPKGNILMTLKGAFMLKKNNRSPYNEQQ